VVCGAHPRPFRELPNTPLPPLSSRLRPVPLLPAGLTTTRSPCELPFDLKAKRPSDRRCRSAAAARSNSPSPPAGRQPLGSGRVRQFRFRITAHPKCSEARSTRHPFPRAGLVLSPCPRVVVPSRCPESLSRVVISSRYLESFSRVLVPPNLANPANRATHSIPDTSIADDPDL
jgi:hypothetical protein